MFDYTDKYNIDFLKIKEDPKSFLNKLNELKTNKLIKFSPPHSSHKNLVLCNYTDIVNSSMEYWDVYTCLARGMCIDQYTGQIVARSFTKFFNYSPPKDGSKDTLNQLQEKVDGSLVTAFYYQDKWILYSKGSFNSKHVTIAEKLFNSKYKIEFLDQTLCHSFELVSPKTRILVDYGQEESLRYLRSFHLDSLKDVYNLDPRSEFDEAAIIDIPKFFSDNNITDIKDIPNLKIANAEGYVALIKRGDEIFRAKVKFSGYKNLSKPISPEEIYNSTLLKLMKGKTEDKDIPSNILKDRNTLENTKRAELYNIINKIILEKKGISSEIIKISEEYNENILSNEKVISIDFPKETIEKYKNDIMKVIGKDSILIVLFNYTYYNKPLNYGAFYNKLKIIEKEAEE